MQGEASKAHEDGTGTIMPSVPALVFFTCKARYKWHITDMFTATGPGINVAVIYSGF